MKQPHQINTASWYFDHQDQGVSAVGMIPQGLPSLTLLDLCLIEQLFPRALGGALMSFAESIAIVRAARAGSPKSPPWSPPELRLQPCC